MMLRSTLTSHLLCAAMLLAVVPVHVEGDSTLTIISELKSFRDASVTLCEGMAKGLEADSKEDAETTRNWCNDWLSVLGLNKGLTGLAKDFVLNYLGRSSYHSKNGPLINEIKKASSALSQKDPAGARQQILAIAKEGRKLFTKGGALYNMLDSVSALLGKERIGKHFESALKDNTEVKKAFAFFSGPAPDTADDDDEEL